MNLSSFTDVSANDEQVTDIDSGSETSHRRKNQNTFSWSSMSSSYSQLTQNTSHAEDDDEEEQPIELFSVVIFNEDSDAKNDSDRICQMLSRAASHGDVHTVRNILYDERLRPLVNIDSSDDDCGSTPLIYAACFGNANVVRTLLEAGATVDKQDKRKSDYQPVLNKNILTITKQLVGLHSCGQPLMDTVTLYKHY
jgi:hypothetical protein